MPNNHQICCKHNCKNPVFKDLNKCALHCKKGTYNKDRYSGLLEEFYILLKKYIVDETEKINSKIFENHQNIDDKLSAIKRHNTLSENFSFKNIYFPP